MRCSAVGNVEAEAVRLVMNGRVQQTSVSGKMETYRVTDYEVTFQTRNRRYSCTCQHFARSGASADRDEHAACKHIEAVTLARKAMFLNDETVRRIREALQ